MRRIITIGVILTLTALIGLQLYSNKQLVDSRSNVEVKPVKYPVTVTQVIPQDLSQQLSLLGTVAPDKELTILSETQGRVVSLNFANGTQIYAGMPLAQLENELRQINVETAEANLNKLQQDLKRFENLNAQNATTDMRLQDLRLAVVNAQAQLRQARRALTDASIIAHTNGIVTNKLIEVGSVLMPGTPIAQVVDISKLKVKIQMPESEVYKIKNGDKVTLSASVFPGVSYDGVVSFISPKGDDSHNYLVEIALVNKANAMLKAGTYVTAVFGGITKSGSLTIPREALVGSVKDANVYVVEGEKSKLRKVIIGSESGDRLEVISGLKEGEIVVTGGQINLKDGVEVTVIK
jgi:RND family efflux transporter MFP subunit